MLQSAMKIRISSGRVVGEMLQKVLRTTIISLSKSGWAQRLVSRWGLAWRAASRFVAGETLDQAITVIRNLNSHGLMATLDHLGENTTSEDEARRAGDEVVSALEAIDKTRVRANVSIKLSQLGLVLDEALCRENLDRILRRAQELHLFIRIDMEDSGLTAQTLSTLSWAWERGYSNVGIVLQSYLYRSAGDVEMVLQNKGRVRLCKGAYNEPAAVAFPKKKDVDENYDRLATRLMEGSLQIGAPEVSLDGCFPPIPAFATHDPARIQFAKSEAARIGLSQRAIEFQMLYGIRRDLQDRLVSQGYPVRVYVPYGTHWYPYFMRRLAERPANIWFFVSNFFKK